MPCCHLDTPQNLQIYVSCHILNAVFKILYSHVIDKLNRDQPIREYATPNTELPENVKKLIVSHPSKYQEQIRVVTECVHVCGEGDQ